MIPGGDITTDNTGCTRLCVPALNVIVKAVDPGAIIPVCVDVYRSSVCYVIIINYCIVRSLQEDRLVSTDISTLILNSTSRTIRARTNINDLNHFALKRHISNIEVPSANIGIQRLCGLAN